MKTVTRFVIKTSILAVYVGFLFACGLQKNLKKDFEQIAYPGKLTLYYSNEVATAEKPFVSIANGKEFHTYGKAVVPTIQGMFLLENTIIQKGDVVLDIGTGSGIQAIFAAEKASRIVATDIGEDAVKSTKVNVKRFGLERKIDVRLSDLFESIEPKKQFDVILYNINYPEEENNKDDPLWEVHERFFKEVKNYLKHNGTIVYQSGFIFNIPRIREMAKKNGLQIMKIKMQATVIFGTELVAYTIKRRFF